MKGEPENFVLEWIAAVYLSGRVRPFFSGNILSLGLLLSVLGLIDHPGPLQGGRVAVSGSQAAKALFEHRTTSTMPAGSWLS